MPKEFFGEGCDAGVMQRIEAAIADYRKLGAETVEVSLPNMKPAVPAYYVIAPAEASPISRATTGCAMATAHRITPISTTCTPRAVPKVSVTK